jgi:hypothetical protein
VGSGKWEVGSGKWKTEGGSGSDRIIRIIRVGSGEDSSNWELDISNWELEDFIVRLKQVTKCLFWCFCEKPPNCEYLQFYIILFFGDFLEIFWRFFRESFSVCQFDSLPKSADLLFYNVLYLFFNHHVIVVKRDNYPASPKEGNRYFR